MALVRFQMCHLLTVILLIRLHSGSHNNSLFIQLRLLSDSFFFICLRQSDTVFPLEWSHFRNLKNLQRADPPTFFLRKLLIPFDIICLHCRTKDVMRNPFSRPLPAPPKMQSMESLHNVDLKTNAKVLKKCPTIWITKKKKKVNKKRKSKKQTKNNNK